MNSFRSVMRLWILFALSYVSISEKKEIDWETEVVREIERFELDYGSHNAEQLIGDVFVDDFVYITQNSIVQGDTRDLEKLYRGRFKLGQWEPGHPNIVFTCDNTVLVWAKLLFTIDGNFTQEGKAVIQYEYVGDMAKIRLIQKSV